MTCRTKVLVAAAALFVIYNLNLRAIESRDTRIIEHVALSIAATGDADLDEFPALYPGDGTDLSGDTIRVGGHVRATYPIVASLTAAPFFWVAIQTGLIDPERPRLIEVEAVAKVAASCWTALACLVLGLLVSKMAPEAPTVALMLAAGLATPLWSSAAQAFWSHGPAACFLALGFFLTVAFGSAPSGEIAAGVALGLAVACRPLLAVFPTSAILAQLFTVDRARAFRVAIGCGAVLGAVALYHLWIFGTVAGGLAILESDVVHRQTHRVDSAFSGNPITGLAGILISPSRGLLIFAPIACFAWPAIRAIWNRDRFLRWLLVIPTVLFLSIWSKYAVWWGGHSYGPRYAADLVVPITAIIACGWHRLAFSRSKVTAAAAAAALMWSIGVQAIGVYCYPNGDWNGSPVDVDHAHARLWDWNDSQIVRSVSAGWYRPRWLQQ
jgi:hypothetical protein